MSKRPSRKPLTTGNKKARFKKKRQRQIQTRLIQTSFEKAHDAIALLDDQGCFVDVNLAASQLLGLPRQDLIGKALSTFLAAEFDHPFLPGSVPTQKPLVGEFMLSASQALKVKMEYTLTPQVSTNCHLLMLRDISQRRGGMAAELQLRQQIELFSEVTLKIRQSLQLQEILHTTVMEVQRILKADRVLIYQVYADGTGKAISEAVSPSHQAILDQEFPEEVFPIDYQQLYGQGRVRAIADVHDPTANLADCLVEFVEQFDIQAKLIVPIVHNLHSHAQRPSSDQNQLWGLLIAHQCGKPRQWVEFELELMQQLADQISIALAQAQLLEHQEELVEARTAELTKVNQNLHQEINDRMQAEAALRQSEEQLRLITNALPVLIAYVDNQQHYRFNNRAFEDWLGKSSSEIYGRPLQKIWGEECYQRMQPYVETALLGQAVSYENDIHLADGSVRSVDVTYIPDMQSPSTVKGFFALTSDISDHKEIERMKDEFISVVSHELRTPLTSLHSALKILATGKLGTLSQEGQQMLAIANDSTERLVRLVNNVLDLQRIESGKVILDRQSCNVANLMIQAVEAMQAMAQQHEVTLVTHPKNISVWADADYILQALTNLLSNAIKFSSPGGTVWLTVERDERFQPDDPLPQSIHAQNKSAKRKNALRRGRLHLQTLKLACDTGGNATHPLSTEIIFRVRDEGQGIPANQLKRIFERFQQVDSSDSRKKGGTGLGLTICRKIIEQHNGEIWAESTPGCGSTFFFTLPALKE